MENEALLAYLDKICTDFDGDSTQLETAIGAFIFGRHLGWKPLFLIHSKRTMNKYQEILGLDFRKELPEVGKLARKSVAWRSAETLSNFWKAVTGNTPGHRSTEIDKKPPK